MCRLVALGRAKLGFISEQRAELRGKNERAEKKAEGTR
jgi:hypothetical protein